jgi:hypothetical protein
MSYADRHPSFLRDHIVALAKVVEPGKSYADITQKYHIEADNEQDLYSLTVEQIYALWSGLLGTESDRFAADTTLSSALKAKGERY